MFNNLHSLCFSFCTYKMWIYNCMFLFMVCYILIIFIYTHIYLPQQYTLIKWSCSILKSPAPFHLICLTMVLGALVEWCDQSTRRVCCFLLVTNWGQIFLSKMAYGAQVASSHSYHISFHPILYCTVFYFIVYNFIYYCIFLN